MTLARSNSAFLGAVERPVLLWLAARTPRIVTPDMLTGLGFLGAVCAALGYALAPRQPALLALASSGLVINWLGDSLDGTVARRRGIERPRYGFFLDNSIDIVEQALLAIGFGLSGYVAWGLAAAVLATFFMVSLMGLLRAQVTSVLEIAFYGIGLTEIRLALLIANAALFVFPPQPFAIFGIVATYCDLVALLWLVGNVVVFLAAMAGELRRLAFEEPSPASAIRGSPKTVVEPLRRI